VRSSSLMRLSAKVIDPRMAKYGRATRPYLLILVALGSVAAGLVIAQAWLLASIVAGAFIDHDGLRDMRALVAVLAAVLAGRAAVVWLTDVAAHRASASVKSELRTALVTRGVEPGADGRPSDRAAELATLATTGVDTLDPYYARFLPQVALAAIVPVAVIVAISTRDLIAAALVAVTLPLIPIFMALIGMKTKKQTDEKLRSLQVLSGHFLDVVTGLTTLKTFGRSRSQAERIREVNDDYRRSADATLRVAFLSSLVLELVASVAVALVALSVGLRVLDDHLSLDTALFVLVLAPEAFAPLRQLGANYHASVEGRSAADHILRVVERPLPQRGTRTDVPDPAMHTLAVDDLTVRFPGRDHAAVADVTCVARPGEILALAGPSGSGKSTLLRAVLGLVPLHSGTITIGGADLTQFDPDAWRAHLAWVPQHPHVLARSVGDNVRLGRPDATQADIRRAITLAGLDRLVARAPAGLDTVLGDRGFGLSAGERQRLALARAFVRESASLLLLDEPTAGLDGDTEAAVLAVLRELASDRTVVIAAHRPALLDVADRVVNLVPEGVPV
jgi:thiol reductant ABC exporter CydD subunit